MSDREPPDGDEEEEGTWQPWGTWVLFAINCAVFLGMLAGGASLMLVETPLLVEWGGASALDIWQGQIWRLFSTMFVHGAIWHLGLNMWVFLQVGRELERVLGTSAFVLLYLGSGLFGSALSLLVHPHLSVGASGAIFGVVGGLFAYAAIHRGRKMSRVLLSALTPFVLVTLIVGFLVPFIDNSAHVGGLVAGFLLGYGLLPQKKPVRRPGWVALVIAAAAFVVLLPMALKPAFNPNYESALGWTALTVAGDEEKARLHADRAAALAPDDPSVLLLYGRLAMGDDDEKAKALFSQAILALEEDDPAALMMKLASMVGGRPTGDIAWAFDVRTTRGLCDALLEKAEGKPPPSLANNCAWILVKSTDPRVRDISRGRALARRAVRLEFKKVQASKDHETDSLAAYLHTLAEAHAQAGDPREARITLERLFVMGYSESPVYRQELERFAALTRKARPKKAPNGTTGGAAEPAPSPAGADAGSAPPANRIFQAPLTRDAGESAMMDGGATPIAPESTDG